MAHLGKLLSAPGKRYELGLIVGVVLAGALACSGESGGEGGEGKAEPLGEPRIPSESVEELNVPDSGEGPFADEVFRKGLLAWRAPHEQGACVSCHTPDAIDLARFNYTDAVIMRRAMGQNATIDQAHAIVDLVHYQRDRFGIDKPLDPTKVNFMQPGGEMAPGDSLTERDMNMYLALRERGLRLFQAEPITTVEEAVEARNEVLNLDLRTVKIGFEFNKWTSDEFRGPEHKQLTKWIPEVPSHPKADQVSDWYALHNDYILDPSDANLWRIVDESEDKTDNLNLVRLDHDGGKTGSMFRFKYRNVQIAGHMIRHDDSKLPYPHLVEDPYQFVVDGARTVGSDAPIHDVHARINNMWEVGAVMRGAFKDQERDALPDFVARKAVDWSGDAHLNHLSWFWKGMIYDPALQFSAAGNKAEYFFAALRDHRRRREAVDGSSMTEFHDLFMSTVMWAHEKFGYDTRYAPFLNGDLGKPGHITCRGGLHQEVDVPQHANDEELPSQYLELEQHYASNLVRMVLFNILDYLRRTPVIDYEKEDDHMRGKWLECMDSSRASMQALVSPAEFAELEPVYDEVVSLLESAKEAQKGLYSVVDDPKQAQKDTLFLTPMKYESLPLQYPPEAEEPFPESPISPVYGAKCAGCHGDEGAGHGPGGESTEAFYPPLKGLSFDDFETAVREGREATSGVHMPYFDTSRVSDEELREMYDAVTGGG